MSKLVSIDAQSYAALTSQSLRATIGPLQVFSTTSLKSQESYLTTGMLPYKFLSITRDFFRLHNTLARLYNAAASPASRLRSAGSLAIKYFNLSFMPISSFYLFYFYNHLKGPHQPIVSIMIMTIFAI